MKRRTFIIILLLLFQLIRVAYSQTIDPYCHVEVVSGSPVMFNLVTIQDITQGKELSYLSRIRVFFFKAPKKWEFYAKSNALNFDGPSDNMSVQNIKMNLEHLYFGDVDIQKGSFVDYGWDVNSYTSLTDQGTLIANGWVNNNIYGSRYTMDFVIRFSIRPEDFSLFSDKQAGYYASQAVFYVKAEYF